MNISFETITLIVAIIALIISGASVWYVYLDNQRESLPLVTMGQAVEVNNSQFKIKLQNTGKVPVLYSHTILDFNEKSILDPDNVSIFLAPGEFIYLYSNPLSFDKHLKGKLIVEIVFWSPLRESRKFSNKRHYNIDSSRLSGAYFIDESDEYKRLK